MSSEVAQAIVRVLDQLASAENRIVVSEAAVDMILAKSDMAQSQDIVSQLAELPLIVRHSTFGIFQRVRALQEQAQRVTDRLALRHALGTQEGKRDEQV